MLSGASGTLVPYQLLRFLLLGDINSGGLVRKKSACNVGDLGSIPGWEGVSRRKWQPTPVFSPGEFHGQRSLQSMGSQRVGHD